MPQEQLRFAVCDFLIYCFITAYTPGPNNLLSMSNAARLGFRRSVRFNLGITAGFFIVMSVCVAFSAALYALLPRVELVLELAGAGYMLYLAWKVYSSTGDLETADGAASFRAGMVLQFMNPKIYIYAITAMSVYILPVYRSVWSQVLFTLVLTAIGASGSYAWALFGGAFCRFLTRHTRAVNTIMAALLVYCAVSAFL